jgi:periplasmic protein CpxP/Spy
VVAAGRKLAVKDRPRAIAVLIAVFLLGCLAGSAGSYFWFKKSQDSVRRSQEFNDGAMRNGTMPRPEPMNFKEILQLTPEQDARFKQILGESRKQMTEFRKQTDAFHFEQDAKIKTVISEVNLKLNAILNEEQKKKFAAWQKDFESKRRHSPRRRDFPPPPPQ